MTRHLDIDLLRSFVAIAEGRTLGRAAAKVGRTLDAAGRPYRIAYAAGSMAGLLAVVRSGQAIAVLTQAAVPEDLRILPPGERLPALPSVGLVVKTARARVPALVEQFADHLRGIVPAL